MTVSKRLKKTAANKNNAWFTLRLTLKDKALMQYLYHSSWWLFVYRNVHFYEKTLTIVTKHSILDAAGVLNLPQYALTCIAYKNNLIQVVDKYLTL